MGNVGEAMQKSLIAPAANFATNPLGGLGVGGKKEAFVAKVGEPLTFVELWVRQWVDVFDKKHGTWCVFVCVGNRIASPRHSPQFSFYSSFIAPLSVCIRLINIGLFHFQRVSY